METELLIALPVHPVAFGIFLGFLVVAFAYYVVKFVLSIVTGG